MLRANTVSHYENPTSLSASVARTVPNAVLYGVSVSAMRNVYWGSSNTGKFRLRLTVMTTDADVIHSGSTGLVIVTHG